MTPWLDDGDVRLYHGDCLDVLRALPAGSVHMCATSPPFYGLRDYGTGTWEGGDPGCDHTAPLQGSAEQDAQRRERGQRRGYDPGSNFTNYGAGSTASGAIYRTVCGKCGARRVDQQIGLEETPDQWVARLVDVFREVRRVLRDDGTLWVEIGDSYSGGGGGYSPDAPSNQNGSKQSTNAGSVKGRISSHKPKDLLGQPWLLAFALRADGWYLRSEIIWARPNPMPESVTDRPTKSHSTVFLLSKQPRYFYDADAIRELSSWGRVNDPKWNEARRERVRQYGAGNRHAESNGFANWQPEHGANARSVWTIPTEPTPFAHFATWPQALVRRMILAGTSERGCCPECGAPWVRDVSSESDPRELRDGSETKAFALGPTGGSPSCDHNHSPVPCTVLDPFSGSATTSLVARNHGRHSIGIDLNETYLELAARRLQQLSLLTGDAA